MDAGKTFQNSGRNGMVLLSLPVASAERSGWVIGIIFGVIKNRSMDEKTEARPRTSGHFRHFSSWPVYNMLCSILADDHKML
jgi:hypothetical protein